MESFVDGSKENFVGLYGDENIDDKTFVSEYQDEILDIIADANKTILIYDKFIRAIKFLNKLRFRKCLILHLGPTPTHNIGLYKTRGNYSTRAEIFAEIKSCKKVIPK
jgi:hypothetical protein